VRNTKTPNKPTKCKKKRKRGGGMTKERKGREKETNRTSECDRENVGVERAIIS